MTGDPEFISMRLAGNGESSPSSDGEPSSPSDGEPSSCPAVADRAGAQRELAMLPAAAASGNRDAFTRYYRAADISLPGKINNAGI